MAKGDEPVFSVPTCDSCSRPAILEQAYSGRILCGEHMAKSVRKKVGKELRHQLKLPRDKETTIFVAISGGKDSAVLLDSLVDRLGKRPDVTIIAGTVDEGRCGVTPKRELCATRVGPGKD